jgi:hypothetical protein
MQGSTVVINLPDGDMRAYLASLDKLLTMPPSRAGRTGAPHREAARSRTASRAKQGRRARRGPATPEELGDGCL